MDDWFSGTDGAGPGSFMPGDLSGGIGDFGAPPGAPPVVGPSGPMHAPPSEHLGPEPRRESPRGDPWPARSGLLSRMEQTYVPAMGPRPDWNSLPDGQPRGMGATPAQEYGLAGVALLAVPSATAYGAYKAGPFGAAAGALLAGAAINAFRAVKSVTKGAATDDKEAVLSGTFAVVGTLAAFWLLWKGKQKPSKKRGDADEEA